MGGVLDPRLQSDLQKRPDGIVAMRQSWRDLLFLHFPCDPALVEAQLPEGLSVDTFPDENGVERAWIGLVPFLMKDVRLGFLPPVPGTHTFLETNVRTYVHRKGVEPGVWFFSLDAANRLAVQIARTAFSLPYFHAQMSLRREGRGLTYAGHRGEVHYRIKAVPDDPLPPPEAGGLEYFLLERYQLYAARGKRLYAGRVHHLPYEIRSVRLDECEETLVEAAGLAPRDFPHNVFCDGVDVEIFPLRRL